MVIINRRRLIKNRHQNYVRSVHTAYDIVRGRSNRTRAKYWQHSHYVRAISYDVIRRETQKSRHAVFLRTFVRTMSYDIVLSVNAADTLHVFD